mmetsp:Transcript_36868/g.93161  ORF Transcript_36868/g.93161 Transcript_36868/m.93161 type:complete len:425 (+) Transcript_36868:133-1407(+)|eukprot:jgi/Tetstr1/443392/TSEL_031407.t1
MKGPGAGVALGWAAVGAIAVLGLQACWPAARVESPAGIGYVEAWGAEGATIHLVGSVSQHGTPARAPRSQQQLLLQEAPDSPDGGDGPLTVRLRRRMRPSDTKGTRGGGANAYTSPSEGGTDELGEYSAFVGVFSVGKVSGIVRRNTVRRTWFPASEAALAAYESKHNVKMRFVIGKDPILGAVPKEIVREEALHGAFVHINVNEVYDNLKLKMMRYFTTVPKLFNARYYLKVDDDTYFRPDRIALVVPQWEKRSADYIGCSMRGGDMMDKPDRRYYDPQRHLIHGSRYFQYHAGPAYAMSRRAVRLLASVPDGGLRFWGAGDASFGAWMLAFNVTHLEDRRLCSPNCNEINALAHWGNCNGLCGPSKAMLLAHKGTCGTEPAIPRGMQELPWKPWASFNSTKEKCHQIHGDWLDHSRCRTPDT